MKFFALLLVVTAVVAVPVAQVPEANTEKAVEVPVVEVKKAEEPVAVEAKKAEPVAVEGKKAEPVAVEAKKAEDLVAVEKTGGRGNPAPQDAVAAVPKVANEDLIKEQALSQVMKAVADLASPFDSNEFNTLKEMMSKGSEMLAEAEKKAMELQSKAEFQNLIQGDALFGIKADGSVDAEAATEQVSQLLSLFTGTTLSQDEKTLLHDIIGGVAGIFSPLQNQTDPLQRDLEKLAEQFTNKFEHVQKKLETTSQDKLLDSQTLLSLVSEDNEGGIDTQLLTDVTGKFLDRMTEQFEHIAEKIQSLDKH